jgi:hypothetical protein
MIGQTPKPASSLRSKLFDAGGPDAGSKGDGPLKHDMLAGVRSRADGTVPPQKWPLVRSGGARLLVVYPDDYPKASGRNGLVV